MIVTQIVVPADQVPPSDLNGVLGNYATLGLNIADFSRYSNKVSAQNAQAFVIPFIFSELSITADFRTTRTHHFESQRLLVCLASSPPLPLKRHMGVSFGTPSKSSISGWNPARMVVVLLPPSVPLA